MNIKNKIISAVCAMSMLATMCAATIVNADAKPKVALKIDSVSDSAIVLDVVATGADKIKGFGVKVAYDNAIVKDKDDKKDIVFSSDVFSSLTTNSKLASNGGFSISAADSAEKAVPADGVVATATLNLTGAISDNVEFTVTSADLGAIGSTDANTIDVEGVKAYVPVTVKNITADDGAVYVGKAAALTAELDDATKLGDRVVTWKTNDSDKYTITVDPTDSTKATLTATAAGKVTVTATVDNNGTSSEKSVEFEGTVKPEPTAYTVTATAVNTANGTTVTVKPDAEYTGTREAFDIVAQFYTEDGTAAGWVKVAGIAALNSGEYSVNLNAQNAAKVSVTVYKADTNTVIGKN